MATVIRSKLSKPVKVTLPKSAFSIELGRIGGATYENRRKWDNLKKAYLISSEEFLDKYIEIVRISGKLDLSFLEVEDFKILLQACLKQEGNNTLIMNMTDKQAIISLFRDEIMGVPYELYIRERPTLKDKLLKVHDGHRKQIKKILDKNLAEGNKINSSCKHEEYKKARRFRIEQNTKELRFKERIVSNSIESIELEILEILKQKVYDRENFIHQFAQLFAFDFEQLDPQYLDFPLRWCGFLPSDEFNRLYIEWKEKGADYIAEQVIDLFQDKDNQDSIIAQLSDSTINEKRKDIIFEAVLCFYEKKYSPTICLLLPQIEGLLWELAELLNCQGKAIFAMPNSTSFNSYYYKINKDKYSYHMTDGTIKWYSDVEQNDLSNLALNRDKNGKEVKLDKIRLLIEDTAFRFYLNTDFVSYYCGELCVERNEILHGRDVDFGTPENATKKLLTLLMILHYFEVYG